MSLSRRLNTIYIDNLNQSSIVPLFLRKVYGAIKADFEDIILDFSNIQMLFPNAVVPVAGIIDFYQNQGVEFIRIDSEKIIENIYLMNPLSVKDNEKILQTKVLNKVWKFCDDDDVFQLVNAFLDELQKIDQFEAGVLDGLEWSLNEVMDNVIQHSNSTCGYVMGQIHQNSKHIAFCIYDSGQGIYNSLKNSKHAPKTSIDAITLALKEGITRDKKVGQGNGLYGLHRVVELNSGMLSIISGDASYHNESGKIFTKDGFTFLSKENGATAIDFQLDYDNEVSISEALDINGHGYQFVNHRIEAMENDAGNIDFILAERAQGFGTRKSGERARNEILNIYQQSKIPINLDFQNINVISSSFADELVGKLVIELGFFGFNTIIRLKNMNPLVQSILQRSVAQRMAESIGGEEE